MRFPTMRTRCAKIVSEGAAIAAMAGLLALAGAFAGAAARANTLLVGGTPSSSADRSFIPFGDLTTPVKDAIQAYDDDTGPLPAPRYQQVYDSSLFLFPKIRITEISFFESAFQNDIDPGLLGGTTCSDLSPECGLFTIRLSTSPRPVDDLLIGTLFNGDNFDDNMNDDTEVFVADILLSDFLAGGVLSIPGDPYVYSPDDGNLIIDIVLGSFESVNDVTQGLGTFFFEATDDLGFPAETVPYSTGDNYNGQDNSSFGMVTQFEFTTIPEPSTALLVAGGLIGMSAWRRHRIHASRQSRFSSPV